MKRSKSIPFQLQRKNIRRGLALLLGFLLVFGSVPGPSWQTMVSSTAQAAVNSLSTLNHIVAYSDTEETQNTDTLEEVNVSEGQSELEQLINQPLPEWEGQQANPHSPTTLQLSEAQILLDMPELQPEGGSGGAYLNVIGENTEAFSPVGNGETTVTFEWNDNLDSWINSQSGTPVNAPSGYTVTVNVRDIKSKDSYQISNFLTNSSGTNSFTWDGTDSNGELVPDGVYEWYLEADSVRVEFEFPPAEEGEDPRYETKQAPGYSAEYRKIVLDRVSPQIIAVHDLGNDKVGVELRDEVSGLYELETSAQPNQESLDTHPLHVIVPVTPGSDETLSITIRDHAGNETTDQVAAYPVLAHMGSESYWPQASGQIGGESISVNLYSGNGYQAFDGFTQPGIGLDVSIDLFYNHQNRETGSLGYGWGLSTESRVIQWPNEDVRWTSPEGTTYTFQKEGSSYQTYVGGQEQYYPQLTRNALEQYVLTWSNMAKDIFTPDGRILQHHDRYQNIIDYKYKSVEKYHRRTYQLTALISTTGKRIQLNYDEETGQLTDIVGPGPDEATERSIAFTYNDADQLESLTDVMDETTTFSYDDMHRLKTVTNQADAITTWTYTSENKVDRISMIRRSDQVEEFIAIDNNDDFATVTSPEGVYQLGWDIQGRPSYKSVEVTVDDQPIEAKTEYVYDKNQLIKEVDPLGRTQEYKYDQRNRLTAFRSPTGRVMTYAYNDTNDLTEETGPYGYNVEYLPITDGTKLLATVRTEHVSDPFGRETPYQVVTAEYYTDRGLLDYEVDGEENTIRYTYDQDGNMTFNGFDEAYTHDLNGNRITKTIHPGTSDVSTTSYLYNNRGQMEYVQHPNGLIEEWVYNEVGLLENHVQYDQTQPTTKREALSYIYDDGQHQVTKTTETMETHFTVDGMGHAIYKKQKPAGSDEIPVTFHYTYDNRGLLTKETTPRGEKIKTNYNLSGERIETVSYPDERVTTYEYDDYGRLTAVVAPDGGRREYRYDLWDRQVINKEYRHVVESSQVPFEWKNQDEDILVSEYRYNSSGQLIEEKSPSGSWTRYTYDQNGHIETETDGGPIPEWEGTTLSSGEADTFYEGHEILSTRSYAYDVQGRLIKQVDGEGYATEYEYNGLTTLEKTPAFDEHGDLTTYTRQTTYDAMGNIVKEVSPEGYIHGYDFEYEYDVFDKITLSINPERKKLTYFYDQNERLDYTREDVDKSGRTQRTSYSFDQWGHKDKVWKQLEGANYAVTDYDYNALGYLKQKIEPSGLKTKYDYDDYGRIKEQREYNVIPNQRTDTRTTTYGYDSTGRKIKTTWPDQSTSYFLYDTTGNRVMEKDQEGRVSLFSYNEDGLVSTFKELDKANDSEDSTHTEYELVYDGRRNEVLSRDSLGALQLHEYDKVGRQTAITFEGSRIGGEAIIEQVDYDPRGLVTTYRDGERHKTTYSYNADGRLVKEVDPEGIWTKYEYSPTGFQTAVRRPLGRDTETEYNLIGQKVVERDAKGHTYTFDYDVGGRLSWETNKRLDKIRYEYDDAGRMIEKYTPNEGMYSYAYDSVGNQVQVDKPVYGTTYYTYDERNNLLQVDEPGDGGERLYTTYTYDDVGNRLSQRDPNGQKTKYEYDYANRKKTETMYLNGISYTFSFDYDTEGNLLYEEKPGGQWIDYDYDFMNRLAYENHSDGRWASYTYYNDGELKTEKTIEGTTIYTYYKNGQTKTVSFPNGDLVEYQYDDNGDVDVEIVNGQPREYVRDETGLTSTYTDAKGFPYEYTYDPDGFVDEITLPNGVKTKYAYKPGHLVDEKETTAPNGQAIYVNTYDHNKRDYITSVDENGRNFAYSYESREQLEQVSTPEGDIRLYDYDGAGNRTTRRAIIGGVEYDRGEVIELEELLEMILLAIKDEEEDEEDGEGKAKGNEKNNSKGKGKDKEKGNNKDNGNKKDQSTFLEPTRTEHHGEVDPLTIVAYDGDITQLLAAKGAKNDKGKKPDKDKGNSNDKSKDNGKDNNLGNSKDKGKPSEKGWENALKRGNGKKYGLYKKLGLIDGPFEHKTGQVENIIAVLDHIVNGEVNLPPGEHTELFELVRDVGQGYTVMGTTWEYNERNEIIGRDNQIRIESYDYDHDDAGNMTTDGRSIYGWNAKDQLEKVTFPDGFGQTYEYDAKGRRTQKTQLNHQENSQWEVNYHYQGDTWQITHETDQDGNTLMEFTYDEQGKPLSITYKGETFWYVYNGQDDVVALTDKNGEIAARYEYDEWGLVTRMYNRHGERIREGIGWMGDLNTGNGTPGSRLGSTEDDDDIDYHPGNGKGKGLEKNKKKKENKEDTEELDSPTTQETESTTEPDLSSEVETVTSDVYDAGTIESYDEEVTEDITTELVKENPYRYRHYYWDRKTQFYYLQARYYNPRIARFISMDPWRGEMTHPLSLNRYVYSLNNPVNYVDPTGLRTYLINGLGDIGTGSYMVDMGIDLTSRGIEDIKYVETRVLYKEGQSFLENVSVEGFNVILEWVNVNVYSVGLAQRIKKDYEESKTSEINLIGYSGGGQIALNAAELLESENIEINTIILLGAPVYEMNVSAEKVYNYWSELDGFSWTVSWGEKIENRHFWFKHHWSWYQDEDILDSIAKDL